MQTDTSFEFVTSVRSNKPTRMIHVFNIAVIVTVICFGKVYLQDFAPAPLNCAAVLCKVPDCDKPITKPGQCCPICPLIPAGCWHKGKFYKEGSSFKDDCNTCWCAKGQVLCTKIGCIKKNCYYKGKKYSHGTSFKDDCNTCRCDDGHVSCTEMACLGCRYGGKYYKNGDNIPQSNPCKSCFCRNGNVDCHFYACPAIWCPNPVKKPDTCCPICKPILL